MQFVSKHFTNECKKIVASRRRATIWVVLLALLPFSLTFSLTLIALVTLRKGWREGLFLLMPVAVFQLAVMTMSGNTVGAFTLGFLATLPCFLGACVLRNSNSWVAVVSMLFLIIATIAAILQFSEANYIQQQFSMVESTLNEIQPNGPVAQLLSEKTHAERLLYANFLFSIQGVLLFFSTMLSLMLARGIQAKLYNPGGFKQELLSFRGSKVSGILLLIVLFAAKQHVMLAVNVLPILLIWYFLAGLSLAFHALSGKRALIAGLLVAAPILLFPVFAFPVYALIGLLDTFIDFRIYLPSKAT